jgi:ribosomal protein S7
VMLDGKKSVAERIVYDALAILGERTGRDRSRCSRVDQGPDAGPRGPLPPRGRRDLPGPVEVPARRARTLAVRWLVEFSRRRREKTMAQRLANELLDAQSPAGRRLQAQGRHLPAWRQANKGLRPLHAGRPLEPRGARRLDYPSAARARS